MQTPLPIQKPPPFFKNILHKSIHDMLHSPLHSLCISPHSLTHFSSLHTFHLSYPLFMLLSQLENTIPIHSVSLTTTPPNDIKPFPFFCTFPFLRFYTFTESSQMKLPHHHPRAALKTMLYNPASYPTPPYKLQITPPQTRLFHQTRQRNPA